MADTAPRSPLRGYCLGCAFLLALGSGFGLLGAVWTAWIWSENARVPDPLVGVEPAQTAVPKSSRLPQGGPPVQNAAPDPTPTNRPRPVPSDGHPVTGSPVIIVDNAYYNCALYVDGVLVGADDVQGSGGPGRADLPFEMRALAVGEHTFQIGGPDAYCQDTKPEIINYTGTPFLSLTGGNGDPRARKP